MKRQKNPTSMTAVEREQVRAGRAGSDMTHHDPGTQDGSSYYTGERNGRFYALGFRRKAVNAAFYYWWATAEERERHLNRWIEELRQRVAEKAKGRAPHSLKVGDILASSWGYEQTNVEFYEVIAVRGAAVDLAELQRDITYSGPDTGTCMPIPGAYTSVRIHGKRPDSRNRVTLTSFQSATPWNGRPMSWSSYA